MKKHFVSILSITLMALTSCAQRNVDGGSCSYTTTNYPAVIIFIYEVDSTKSDMFLATNIEGDIDTVGFYSHRQQYFQKEEMIAMNYKVGDTLTYQVKRITSGHCSPYIKSLTKERYTK